MKLNYEGYKIKTQKIKGTGKTKVTFRKKVLAIGETQRKFSTLFYGLSKITDTDIHFMRPIKINEETYKALSDAAKDFDLIDRYLDLFVDEVGTEELQEMINA